MSKLFESKVDVLTRAIIVKAQLSTKRAQVERLNRNCVTNTGKRQELLAERRMTNQSAICLLAETEGSFQEFELKAGAVTAKMNKWHDLVTEVAVKLEATQAHVALQSAICESR